MSNLSGRPKPPILLSHINPKTFRELQVLKAGAVFAVIYDGQPINLRMIHTAATVDPRYRQVSFSNPGHAHNLREKLNALFRTDKFHVVRFDSGEIVTEDFDAQLDMIEDQMRDPAADAAVSPPSA